MSDKAFGNGYNTRQSIAFFKRWYKLLILVFVVAAVLSAVASYLIDPLYKSTAVIFPTNSNRVSKAIMDYHYSLDFMDYGLEKNCEYTIEILSSQSMQRAVCNHFNMAEHYGIKEDDPYKNFKVNANYRNNVSIKRTDYLAIEISVLDVDPVWAADIANYIAEYYDTLCHQTHMARATDASRIMQNVCDEMTNELYALEDKAKEDKAHATVTQELISNQCKKLADIQTRATETKVDMQNSVSYKFWLDKAVPADKKAYPKRVVITLLGSFSALVFCILVLLLIEIRRKEKPSDKAETL